METPTESERKTWLVVLICVAVILLQGFLAFFVVGDKDSRTGIIDR